jgi:ABC-2 type transport system permease protein
MKALLVARKTLLELAREWQLLLLVVGIPVSFLWITKLGYGSPLLVTHPLLVAGSERSEETEALLAEIEAERYAGGRPVFELRPAPGPAAAEEALKAQEATALLSLSPGQRVVLKGDALSLSFYRAGILLEEILNRRADRLAGRPEILRLEARALAGSGPQSLFDVYAPGMIVFALLLTIPQVAMLVARESRWQTLDRLRLTPLRAWELLGGIGLAQTALGVVLVALVLGSALALGFQNQGSTGLALIAGLAVNLSAIGWGLVVGCFVENDGQAINVGSTVAMLQVFLSGSFYQMPSPTLFHLGGRAIELFDVLPATHGFLALQQVLCYGSGWREVAFRLAATLLLSLLTLAVGIVLFGRLRLKEKK